MPVFRGKNATEQEIADGIFAKFFHGVSMSFAHWRIGKDAVLTEHQHPYEQVAHILEGEFELTIGDETYVISKGDVAVIPSNSKHKGRAITDCIIIDAFHPKREDYASFSPGDKLAAFATDLPDYRYDPHAYEKEERARPDEMAMIESAISNLREFAGKRKSTTVLDLCCGTGLPLSYLLPNPFVSRVDGIDICSEYLAFARERFRNENKVNFIEGDVISAKFPIDTYDAVLMCSAYHHVDDPRKLEFLRRVRSVLASDGRAFVAENILPPYLQDSDTSYEHSVKKFYEAVLEHATTNNPELPSEVKQLIQRVAKYGCDGDYEYKVSIEVFLRDISLAGLAIESLQKVWPFEGSLAASTGGNYVFTLRRA